MRGWVFSLIGVGWYVAISIILGVVVGMWLDKKFGTAPLLAIAGIILGSFMAFFGVYKMLLPGLKPNGEDKDE
ncbi:MAG: AtpZ/AtpI family protein [Dehalococcoidia bacterium]|nr:AtpZ/AtpI family protein [Dehalococcoidia bacterium]MDP7240120.1 AtpZ/AtpI family protein [Dehalococcoidia bacterium]MDP7470331.1 AtpZ/AtpI family protein [Dehalococcoidia bacterium]